MFENLTERVTDKDETRTDSDTASATESESTTETDSSASGVESRGANVDFDQVFGLLKNRRRRRTLRYLIGESEQVRLGELAEQIAAHECDKEVSHIDSQERKRVYVALYQCHLPKMADVDAIAYDKPRGTIERGPNFALFETYLPSEERTVEPGEGDHDWMSALTSLVT